MNTSTTFCYLISQILNDNIEYMVTKVISKIVAV